MYIQFYDSEKQSYESAGIEQTKIFNELEVIYRNVKAMQTLTISVHNNPSTLSCPGFTARSSANRSSEVTGTHIINFTVNLKNMGWRRAEPDTEGHNPAFALLSRQSGDHFTIAVIWKTPPMLQPMKNSASWLSNMRCIAGITHPVYVL